MAVVRQGKEIEFCDEAKIVLAKEQIEGFYPYHTTVKKLVSSTAAIYWGTVMAGLGQTEKLKRELDKIKKEMETAKARTLNDFNEILFRCAPEMEKVSKER